MAAASETSSAGSERCFCQYCITMAMLAAPQPSFSCRMNGTSSQTPGTAPKTKPQRHKMHKSLCGICRTMKTVLADGHDNQHEHRNAEDNQNQIAFAEIAGGEISLGFVRPCGQLGQFLIVKG